MSFDVCIRNGMIIDGTGNERYKADIVIKDGKIAGIGSFPDAEARYTIDASGRVVSPGFIDTHVHSDVMLLWDRQHACGLYQGVTTEILGQDGLSYAPLSKDNLEMYFKYLGGLNGTPDIPLDWSTVEEYRSKFDGTVAINTAYQVPHGVLRLETVGFRDVPLTGAHLEKAKRLLADGIDQGAVAFSTGLSYFPGSYGDTQELIELSRVLAEKDSIYVTHLRTVFKGEKFDAIQEALDIGWQSGCKIHYSHFRTGPNNAGKVDELMGPIDDAYQKGLDVSLELYPYAFGSSTGVIHLPPWTVEGGYESTLERLADKKLRPAIVRDIQKDFPNIDGTFSYLPSGRNDELLGLTFQQAADLRGQTVYEVLCDLLLEEKLAVGILGERPEDESVVKQIEDDLFELLSRPYYMVGSDAIYLGQNPHPRAFGSFPKLLRLAREKNFSLEVLINRMTMVPAERFGLKDRGVILEGKAADLVVFDAETVTDTSVVQQARTGPSGISHVLVNGEIAVWNEKVTGVFAGRALPVMR
ncbi:MULTISPECIES: N-acyl-D-amino-acid deacylase family protein [Paenibacillus]|uniref:Amidohydrolase family protein n=1 Tax=Paenibacillus residui TaxID=629724 RepID=A0ABW3DH62_9BACL